MEIDCCSLTCHQCIFHSPQERIWLGVHYINCCGAISRCCLFTDTSRNLLVFFTVLRMCLITTSPIRNIQITCPKSKHMRRCLWQTFPMSSYRRHGEKPIYGNFWDKQRSYTAEGIHLIIQTKACTALKKKVASDNFIANCRIPLP